MARARGSVWRTKQHNDDGLGPLPPWAPDAQKPYKPGQSRGAFIWPRDKNMSSPFFSLRRWKDVFSGKGPPIYFGHRQRFGPTRDTWSGWTHPNFDNLGYRSEDVLDYNAGEFNEGKHGVYDFKKRRFTRDWARPEVWSDVKWGRAGQRGAPLYHRDGYGVEWTKRNGRVWPFDTTEYGNDFRYRPHMDNWDWIDPWCPTGDYSYIDSP